MFRFRKFKYVIPGLLFIATVFVWVAVFEQEENNILKVVFFDVGQGDSIFIETPGRRQVLIDGGPDSTVLERLNQVMPIYDRSIDLVVLTHPDSDHITGLVGVLEHYQVGHILTSGFETDSAVYKKWKELIENKNIPLTLAQTGQRISLESFKKDNEIVMDVLWPDQSKSAVFKNKANNASVVFQLNYLEAEILLTGDIEKEVENYLIGQNLDLDSDILKIPHHGSKTSSQVKFIEAVSPEIAIISVGENNRYGHPHQIVLDRLKQIRVYRTDRHGSIKVLTDGNLFDIKKEK